MFKKISLSLKRSQRRLIYFLISLFTALGLVVGTAQPGYSFSWLELLFRGAQIIQMSNMTDSQEVNLGKQINQRLISSRQIRLYDNRQINAYVDQIGQKLVPNSNRPDIPYTFQVVKDDAVNAFATMGGYNYVTTGLIKAADNEAELASVISHEIAHITERHAVKQMRQRAVASGLLSAAGLDQNAAVNIGVELALQRPNSRQDELEADTEGLKTLRNTGYAPSAFASFMQKLQRNSNAPNFLSTHPSPENRVERLQAGIDPATAQIGRGLDQAVYRQNISPLL